ncbi:UNVERIFIED_CONTAM: hypothetical protein GTU68_059199 [Idotea baltica]|nr:hypothetical protein [Idotea baltica]
MDLVIRVPRIPKVGETIIGRDSHMIFGGKGANQAIAAKRAGGDVLFLAKVGKDAYGTGMIAHFSKEGLPVHAIMQTSAQPTGVAQIWVSDKGENSIVVAPGANGDLLSEDIDLHEDSLLSAAVVLLQLETPLSTVAHIVKRCKSANIKTILNPAPAAVLGEDLLDGLYLITPNETEAFLLTGIKVTDHNSALMAAKELLGKGVQNVIITMGSEGCLLLNAEGHKQYSAIQAEVKDTTAAGDVFNGVLAAFLTLGKTLDESIKGATAAASISVTRLGAQPSAPYADEIIMMLSTLDK